MEGIRDFWGTGIGKVLIVSIIGGVLLVCVLLGMVLFGNYGPESPSEPEQELSSVIQTQKAAETALASQPTATTVPTDMPLPTDTFVPGTIVPTSTPVATGTVAPDSSPYLDEVNVNLQAYQNAFADVERYVQESTTDFSVLLKQDWKKDAGMALNQLDEAANQLENIDGAPPEQEQLDMYIKSIAKETHQLVDNYNNAMDQLDPNAINNAVGNLGNINSYMNSATQELNQFLNP